MKVIKSLRELPPELKFGLTIGNFDGVHLGHREILGKTQLECQRKGLAFVVVTFVPHPLQILKPKENFLITSYEKRRSLLGQLGVDYLFEIDFTRDFSTLCPEDFLSQFIETNPNLIDFYMGYDFAFGANKKGDFDFVSNYFESKSVNVLLLDEYKNEEGLVVSSSSIRHLLEDGNVVKAAKLLGHHFCLEGIVTKGEGRGRQIGFPTANLDYEKKRIVPSSGVYITKVQLGNKSYSSVTNIGINPTFNTEAEIRIETHIFNLQRDIYGEEMILFFYDRIRDERKFSSVEELKLQIALDAETAYKYFNND